MAGAQKTVSGGWAGALLGSCLGCGGWDEFVLEIVGFSRLRVNFVLEIVQFIDLQNQRWRGIRRLCERSRPFAEIRLNLIAETDLSLKTAESTDLASFTQGSGVRAFGFWSGCPSHNSLAYAGVSVFVHPF